MGPVVVVGGVVTAAVVADKQREARERRQRAEREAQRRKEQLRSNLRNQINSLNGTIKLLNEQLRHLQEIKNYQSNFRYELNNNTKICVVIGKTGDGKSTLCNRLYGDKSLRANEGPFKVYRGVHSGTQNLSKYRKDNISIIDTPGIFDSNNKDKENILKIINYLKGSPGINAFIIVFNGTDARYDDSKIQMLNQFNQLFGKQFWKHVILVISKIDDQTKGYYQDTVKEIKNEWPKRIRKQFKLNTKEAPLKVYSIGIRNETNISNIKNTIKSNSRLTSSKITFESPNSVQNQINNTNNKISSAKNEKNNAQNRLNSV